MQATDHPDLRAVLRFVDRNVPRDARIAIQPSVWPVRGYAQGELLAYPFFGRDLSRTVLLAESLRQQGKADEADRMALAIAEAKQRDLVVELTWDGNADLDHGFTSTGTVPIAIATTAGPRRRRMVTGASAVASTDSTARVARSTTGWAATAFHRPWLASAGMSKPTA